MENELMTCGLHSWGNSEWRSQVIHDMIVINPLLNMEKEYNSAALPAEVVRGYNCLLWVTECSHEKDTFFALGLTQLTLYMHCYF